MSMGLSRGDTVMVRVCLTREPLVRKIDQHSQSLQPLVKLKAKISQKIISSLLVKGTIVLNSFSISGLWRLAKNN
jgi:hypothetical protein